MEHGLIVLHLHPGRELGADLVAEVRKLPTARHLNMHFLASGDLNRCQLAGKELLAVQETQPTTRQIGDYNMMPLRLPGMGW